LKLLLDTHALYWYVEGDPRLVERMPIASGDAALDSYGINRIW
jgi:PIN domain nuclease of toxin-antitoxin system